MCSQAAGSQFRHLLGKEVSPFIPGETSIREEDFTGSDIAV
jgi:hypothetical protein